MDHTIKVRTLAILVALIVSAGLASAASETGTETGKAKGNLGIEDERFIKEAASGGMMEVALGKTAAEKADNEQVREFGKRMQADHSRANDIRFAPVGLFSTRTGALVPIRVTPGVSESEIMAVEVWHRHCVQAHS